MSACNLLIEVLNPDGTPLAESKPQGPDDGLLDVTLPQDGSYLLAASELTGNHGPAVVYRLEVEPLRPSFSLKLEVTKVDAAAGGTFHIKVKCDRHGFDGPIRLSLDGDARTFVTQGAVLPADGKEADVEVALPPTVSPVKPLAFRVIGKAIIFGLERRETASTTTPLVLIFPRLMVLPPGIDGVVGLMVRPAGE